MLDVTRLKRMIVVLLFTQSTRTHRTRLNIALAVKTSTYGNLTSHYLVIDVHCISHEMVIRRWQSLLWTIVPLLSLLTETFCLWLITWCRPEN